MISVVIISKDEESLDKTVSDVGDQAGRLAEAAEIVVVDASNGRLDHIRRRYETAVRWVQFEQPPGVRISIPHQRNAGVRAARGEIIVFTDAGCRPEPDWLARLVAPLFQGEHPEVLLYTTKARNELRNPAIWRSVPPSTSPSPVRRSTRSADSTRHSLTART